MGLMGAATSKQRGGSAAAVLDFAAAQILRDDTALGALPAVLDRMVAAFGLRAAVVFRPSAGQDPRVVTGAAGLPAEHAGGDAGRAAGQRAAGAVGAGRRPQPVRAGPD